MKKIKHFLQWMWIYAIPLGLLGVALSLGLLMSGIWFSVLTLNMLPATIALYAVMFILWGLCVLLAAGSIQAIAKIVKLYRVRHM